MHRNRLSYIGWQGAFYNVAKIIGTGLLVYLAGFLKDEYEVLRRCGTLFLDGHYDCPRRSDVRFGTLSYPLCCLPGKHAHSVTSFFRRVWPSYGMSSGTSLLKSISVYYIMLYYFISFCRRVCDEIVPLFLKAGRDVGGLGLTEQEIGIYYGTFGAAAFVLGSLLGGYYISARGLKKTLFSLCCVFNLPFMAYTLLAIFQPQSAPLIGGAIVLEYFGYGFGFVGLTLFMMQQVAAGPHQMAHYAFASGIMNLGVMLPGMMSGYVSDWLGYKLFFIFVLVAAIPAFLMTWFVPFTHEDKK